MALPYTIDEVTKTITILSSMNLSILPAIILANLVTYSFVINTGATLTLDTSGTYVYIKDLSGSGNIELDNKILTIRNADSTTFSGVISSQSCGVSDIIINQNNTATINFDTTYSNIDAGTVVKVFNSSVSIFNNNYTILSVSVNSATATPLWARSSKGGVIYQIRDTYVLSDIVIDNDIATINFANPYTPIDPGKVVTVVASDVSTLNNDYTIISSTATSATATYYNNWVPTSLGGSINKIDDVIIIPEYKLSAITIQNNIATIWFAPDDAGYYDYTPIDVGKIVTVVNSSVSIFNNTYTVISSTSYNAIATPNWILKANGGVQIVDDFVPTYVLSDIVIDNGIATITFANPYTPIGVGKIVTVVASDVSIFNNTYTIISSTETSATATPSWILGSNGGTLASVQIADKNSLILSGGILTLSGKNTYTGKTLIAAGKLNISSPIVLTPYSFVIDSGATIDISGNSGTNLSIIDLSGSGNMELGNQLLTITNAANSTFSGVISNPSSYNLRDIVINNNIATINFAEPCGNIAVGEIVAVANSSVSTLNNDYRIVSFSENSATATYYYNWVPTSLGGSINKIDDVMIIPEYKLSGITIQDNIASINFAPDDAGYYYYTPIGVGKIVTVVNSSVSIFNNTYTVISSTYYNAIATPNWVLKSNGGSLDLESNYSLYLSGGTLTLSGINTYSGGTRLDNSKLILTNSKSLGLGDAGILCIDGNLLFTDTFTISKFLLTNSATNLGTQLSVVTGKTVTFAAGVGGRFPLIVGDANNKGSVEFSNEYRGPLTVYKDVSVKFNVSVILIKPVIIDTGSNLNLAGNGSKITDTVHISSGARVNSSGVGTVISGKVSGSGDVNATGGDMTLSGNNLDLNWSGKSNVGSGATLITSTGTNDYPSLPPQTLLEGGSTLKVEIPVQQVPQNFAAFASFALANKKVIKVLKNSGQGAKVTVIRKVV